MAATDLLGEPTLRAFRDRLRGELFRPGDEGYDDARALWNGRFDRRLALIARCRTDADVIAPWSSPASTTRGSPSRAARTTTQATRSETAKNGDEAAREAGDGTNAVRKLEYKIRGTRF